MIPFPSDTEETVRMRAWHRIKEVREFWGNFWLYVVVNAVFVAIDLADGTEPDSFIGLDWAHFPLIGWGAFVLAHFVSVFWFKARFGANWEARKLERYTELERRRPSRFGPDDDDMC